VELKVLFAKVVSYYKRNGILRTIKHIPVKLRWTIFRKRDILYVCELADLDISEIILPENIVVEKKESFESLTEQELQALCGHQNSIVFTDQLKGRFNKRSVIWLIKVDGDTAGMFWTLTGDSIEPHYFCLMENDVHLYNGQILEHYRGRRLFSVLANYILAELKKQGLRRVYVETNGANIAAIRAFEKIYVKKIATARIYRIFGKNVTIWNKED